MAATVNINPIELLTTITAAGSLITGIIIIADRLLGPLPPNIRVSKKEHQKARILATLLVVFLIIGPSWLIHVLTQGGISCK